MLRAPIWFYRAGLGFIFGKRFVMIEHKGRVTGERRFNVLEVVSARPDAVYVMAGWGRRADWYLNLRADPEVTVHLGARSWATTAGFCDVETARFVLSEYGEKHPGTLRRLGGLMLDDPGDSLADTIERLADELPVVAFPFD